MAKKTEPKRGRGRPALSADQKRTEQVMVALTTEEKETIARKAHGTPLARFLRERALGKRG